MGSLWSSSSGGYLLADEKLAYKRAISMHNRNEDSYFSNEFRDLLLFKDITGFCHTWNAKMRGSKLSSVVDGATKF